MTKARETIECATSPRAALEAARRLIGQWPNAKAHDPETYAGSIAAVLAGYPLGIVNECCDPRVGLVRTPRDFPPNAGHVAQWCDERLEHYRVLAAWRPRALSPPELPDNPEMAARAQAIYNDLVAAFRDTNRSPLDMLLDKRAQMRRESIDRILGYAARVAPRGEEG